MPIFNGSLFVAEAINSILYQTYQNFELIVVNDNSKDNTLDILKRYQKTNSQKIKIISLKKRHGAFGAANKGIKQAKGEFLAVMDADDISHPQRLEKEVAYLLQHKNVIVVGGHARIINNQGDVIGKKIFPSNHKAIYEKFFEVHPMVHPSCMIRRSLLPKRDRLYADTFGVNDDYYTFFTLLRFGEFANIKDYLLDYRIHLGNSSLQNLKQKFFNTLRIRLVAIKNLGYKPTYTGIIKVFLQIMLVSFIPETALLHLYLFIKGIHAPARQFNLAFVKVKKLYASLLF